MKIDREIFELLHRLPEFQRKRILEFAHDLIEGTPRGIAGADLLKFAGCISADDLQIMHDAVERDCEKIDLNGW